MTKDEDGRSIYINVWPEALDIEKRIYCPLLLTILPFVGTFFARIVSSILPAIATLLYNRIFVSFREFWHRENIKAEENRLLQTAQEINTLLSGGSGDALSTARDINASLQNDSAIRQFAQMLNMRFSGDFMRVIFGSLAYSLLVFFVGFALVQIILFTR